MSLTPYPCPLALNFWRNVNNFNNSWGWVEDGNDISPCYYCFSVTESSDSLPAHQAPPPLSPGVCWNSYSLTRWCHPTISSSIVLFSSCPQIFPSIRVFSSTSALCIGWPKYWRFSISPSDEYSGLISFRTDWFDLLAVQGTLKSLLQNYNSKASIFQHSAFFMVQLSCLYMTTWNVSLEWKAACCAAAFLFYQICKVFVICRRTPLVGVGADRQTDLFLTWHSFHCHIMPQCCHPHLILLLYNIPDFFGWYSYQI